MSTVSAYAATSPTAPLTKTTIERRDPGPHDVAIDIKFAGICHSDIHTAKGEWGTPDYPLVVGHEIAGVVTAVGSEVTKHKVGDRVGVGCMVNSCGQCNSCKAGLEQYCSRGTVFTYNATDRDGTTTQGGYSQAIVVDENFVLRIPDSLPLDKAAPLLCAGITLFSPLRHWKAGKDTRLAIIGLGGLGHMGVKLGAAMGAEVTVLSQSLKKMEDGLRLGAKHYYATAERETFKKLRNSFDLILNTVSANLNLNDYLSLLDVDGTLVELGIPEHPMEVGAFSLALARRSLSGSNIGGIAETQEMLDFCAEHNVTPEIELIEPDYINEAYERVLASDVRYRFVIDISKL
ncbi:alcohol dehydrogenase [Mycobacterium colombiense]|uniref:NADP-dependent alcohol dehydrogenase C n=1 Tax=Mycobacterium colombiense TaxID=339268 RepID=A0A853M459_9MYCO|nr:NAD(P)-dependent alcohol dehydrogenase [Mycobacterium colombiense]OBJ10995.1 alcohol dehydrogenase [Mycobacterium colombiense]OBJ22389.1 alcohol dehydrogenase [Mycobacterium colombiense]OBJ33155.1 alcohol dehydrogenase [Mycobacterium colombiense]OBJ39374.1 alcohol dehydrogenase [Mycobacterium colombiense]OBJ60958.1 alcohol dehydrogenase [Mycobacterium colombiense]